MVGIVLLCGDGIAYPRPLMPLQTYTGLQEGFFFFCFAVPLQGDSKAISI